MLQIEQSNLLIEDTLSERLFPSDKTESAPKLLDRIISDFDFTSYHISTLPDNNSKLLFSVYLQCWDDLVRFGVAQYLHSKYSAFTPAVTILSSGEIEPGYNYSLHVDCEAAVAQGEEFSRSIVAMLALLKRNAIASAFEAAFARYDELAQQYAGQNTYAEEIQAALQAEPILVVRHRGDEESIFIKPSFDRVTVIFSTTFKDDTDKIFGKVFLQEFVDARKRSVQTAPQVLFTDKEPPLDIQDVVPRGTVSENKGYVTFVLFQRHLTKGDRRENCISHIQFFRNYFHYHVKCAKAYMHSRMRFRVKEFLKVLNRAKPENLDEDGKDARKTATGRKFEVSRA